MRFVGFSKQFWSNLEYNLRRTQIFFVKNIYYVMCIHRLATCLYSSKAFKGCLLRSRIQWLAKQTALVVSHRKDDQPTDKLKLAPGH